jgi:hypothetical protein
VKEWDGCLPVAAFGGGDGDLGGAREDVGVVDIGKGNEWTDVVSVQTQQQTDNELTVRSWLPQLICKCPDEQSPKHIYEYQPSRGKQDPDDETHVATRKPLPSSKESVFILDCVVLKAE